MKKLCVLGLILALLLITVPVVADDSTATRNPIQLAGFGTLSAFNQTVADFSANVTSGAAPLTVGFNDLSVNATGWVWYFGDESFSNPWQQMNASDGFNSAFHNGAVAVPDGSIVYCPARNLRNETYRSTDNGASWQLVNGSGGWEERIETYNSMVVLSDGTIVKMGGSNSTLPGAIFYNDTWTSTDAGSTWQLVNASSGWTPRSNTAAVALSDDSIVLTGGNFGVDNADLLNDVWSSTDKGATWTQINASAGWSPRRVHAVVALSDDSIVLMGGFAGNNRNDTWLSTDKGDTWTQINASPGWIARRAPNAAAMPDDSIVLLGGITDISTFLGDAWRSTDKGATWTQVNSTAFSPRAGHSVAVTSDGSLVVMDGLYTNTMSSPNDVWRLSAEGSTLQNSSHTYTTPGTYQVTLQVYNADGYNSTRKTGYITVTPTLTPVANFTGTPVIGEAPLTVTFTDLSTNVPTVWNWSFGDGNLTNSTVQNPVHTYATPGVYDILLNASNSAGFNNFTRLGYINVTSATLTPVANFTGTPVIGEAPLTVTFTDLSTNVPTVWNWSFGDGNLTNSTVQNPVHTYATPGVYDILLNASNSAGFNNFTRLGYINVTSATLAPVANFTGTPVIGEAPLTVTFTDLSTNVPTVWNWSFGDGNLTNSTVQNPVHTYATPGVYDILLNASNSAGFNNFTRLGYINVTSATLAPVANFTGTPVIGEAPLTVTFTDLSTNVPTVWNWSFGDGNLTNSTVQNPVHTYTTPGVYDIALNASNSAGFNTFTRLGYINVTNASASKIGTYNQTIGLWYLDYDGTGMYDPAIDKTYTWGAAGYQPVTGDWNSDGKVKIGTYNPTIGLWYLDYDGTGTYDPAIDKTYTWGATGYQPVTGDWNGDGKVKIGTYNPTIGLWYLDYDGTGTYDPAIDKTYTWGATGYQPVTGDWNGDGKVEIGTYNPTIGLWYLDYDGTGTYDPAIDKTYTWGATGYQPVTGDWNGDGKVEIGTYNQTIGLWYLDYDGTGTYDPAIDKTYTWGATGYQPVTGDWNSDGKVKIGTYNQTIGLWYLDYDGTGMYNPVIDKTYTWGATGYEPVVGKWS